MSIFVNPFLCFLVLSNLQVMLDQLICNFLFFSRLNISLFLLGFFLVNDYSSLMYVDIPCFVHPMKEEPKCMFIRLVERTADSDKGALILFLLEERKKRRVRLQHASATAISSEYRRKRKILTKRKNIKRRLQQFLSIL